MKRIIQDERFTGTMVGHRAESVDVLSKRTVQVPKSERIIVSNTHEAVVTYEIYTQAQKVIGSRGAVQNRNMPKPLFYQKIKCGRCGHVLRCITNKKGSHYYCEQRKFTVPQICIEQIDEETLKNTVLKILNLFIATKKDEFNKTEIIVSSDLEKQLMVINEKLNKNSLLLNDLITDYGIKKLNKMVFIEKREHIKNEIKLLEAKRTILKNEFDKQKIDGESLVNKIACYEHITELTRQVIETFVKMIYLHEDNRIEIVWNFEELEMKNMCI